MQRAIDPTGDVRETLIAAANEHLGERLGTRWSSMLADGTQLVASRPERRRLKFGRGKDAAPVGWLGGHALLPIGVQWPTWEGLGPMAHIATLDCRELQPHLPLALRSAGFPSAGLLSFFYFDGQVDGGLEVVGALFGTDDGARVIYVPDSASVVPTEPPAPLIPYRTIKLHAEPILTWPTWEHPDLHDGSAPAEGWGSLFEVLDAVRQEAPGPLHQVGGHPDPVQGPVEMEIAYGLLSGGGRDKLDWRSPEILAESRRWSLLAQFDTDAEAGFMWGDGGVLYFMIRPEDLATSDFDRAGFTWQCG